MAGGQLTKDFRWGHGILVVAAWDVAVVERAVRDLILHAEGANWNELAGKLARFTHWEFADYRPLSGDIPGHFAITASGALQGPRPSAL